jgi:multidrug efflux pump subunit AcrB
MGNETPMVPGFPVVSTARTLPPACSLIPIAREIFGPMAYAMMGGIIVGTMLTLLLLPAR